MRRSFWCRIGNLGLVAAVAAVLMGMVSCGDGKKDFKELFEEQQSGVCMVLNTYYYKIELPTGTTWYCSGIDADGDLENFTREKDEAESHRSMASGTAFFIDDEGTLMTNRHVVNPDVDREVIRKATSNLIKGIKEYALYSQEQYAEQYAMLESKKSDCYSYDYYGNVRYDYDMRNQIEAAQRELEEEYSDLEETVNAINNMDMSEIRVTPVSKIGIAYNNTYVTGEDDFLRDNECVVTKVSNDDDIDLALIQLKNKKTPAEKHVFKVMGRDEVKKSLGERISSWFSSDKKDEIDVDRDLMMIGYNAGLILGNTRQGIQAQMTKGKVSQKPDGTRILYSIPTLQGSSGSPVIDERGYVRAVNFAKLSGTDTFNFGIPENQIMKFLKE